MRRLPFWYPPILAYHRVHPDGAKESPTVSPEVFERQMAILSERWRPIPINRLADALEGKALLPSRPVVVTFDDGTSDFYEYALPILVRYRIPATLFMIAGNMGKPGSLNEEQLRSIAAQGITLGSHTLDHDYLPSRSLSQAEESLSVSKEILERIHRPVDFLSYPAGGFTGEIAEIAETLGFRAACTTNRGYRRFPIHRWAFRRITMHATAQNALTLWARCCGYYGWNRRLRAPR